MNRVDARKVAPFVGIDQVVNGKAVALTVPGHDGRGYKVRIDRGENIRYWCPCPGARYSVCYHGTAAVIKAAGEQGYSVSWTGNGKSGKAKATRLANFGGRVFSLTSSQSGVSVWGVAKSKSIAIQVADIPRRPRFMRNRPSIWAPSMRVHGSTPEPISTHGDGDLWVWIKPWAITIGKNTYNGFSKESYNRLHRVLNGLWQSGRAYPVFPEGCHGYCVLCS